MYIKIFGNIVYINLISSVQYILNRINSLQHCVECYKPWNHKSFITLSFDNNTKDGIIMRESSNNQ